VRNETPEVPDDDDYPWPDVSEPEPVSAAEIAEAVGVSTRTVVAAKVAERAGLGDKVRSGELSAKRAEAIATGAPPKPAPKPADVRELQQQVERLTAERDSLRAKLDDLLPEIEAMTTVDLDEQQRVIAALNRELIAVKAVRDDYVDQVAGLKRTVEGLRKALRRYEH
jgi:chromosome segregation ATPase